MPDKANVQLASSHVLICKSKNVKPAARQGEPLVIRGEAYIYGDLWVIRAISGR